MSIKDLFNKKNSVDNVVVAENATASAEYVESFETVRAKRELNDKLIPRIDFSTASNFAKFGSAELYYEYGFERIYNEYPYDGTEEEKINFRLSSSYLDDYIFENLYPRVNGYAQFSAINTSTVVGRTIDDYGRPVSPEYILAKGGPHTASGGMIGNTIASKFSDSNYYDASNNLGSSLELNFVNGATVEFWLKKSTWDTANNGKEVVFDLWNNEPSSSSDYGRLTIALSASSGPFNLEFKSGLNGDNRGFAPTGVTTSSYADGNWHHHAFSFISESQGLSIKYYFDGVKKHTQLTSHDLGPINTVSGNISTIGGLVTDPSGSIGHITGSGKLNAYVDEFRYWKYARTDKQIANSFFIPLAGGNNEYKYNRNLGIYYKFNEGITGTDSVDSVVLDYSGRLANGEWYNYTSAARSTGSAMVESGYARSEFKDPIIYSFHPDVVSTLATLKTTGSLQDKDGTSKLIGMMPGWLQEKDIDVYNNQVKKFLQILGSYFDDLHGQVTEFGNIKDIHYPTATEEPYPFADRLVEDRGLVVPQLFLDGDIVNYLLQKDDNEIFEQNISDLKNRIYHNIYNNLDYILKSKGTEKSFRNLIRCFGIDTEVLRLSLYADDSTYTIQENYENTSIEKKFLNLNNKNNFEGTIYNVSSSDSNFTYISSSEGSQEENTALTFQCETIFPLKLDKRDGGYFRTDFITSSIAGFHRALTSSASDYTWHEDDTDIQIYSVRHEKEGKDGYFVLTSSLGFEITSSTYFNLYDNNKWNFAVRVRNQKYPYTYGLSGSTGADYFVEFVGYNSIGDYVNNYFSLSSSVSNAIGKQLLCNSKRLYAGAHRTNFTGSTLIKSDVLVSDVKYWQSYLDDETIKLHSFNPDNAGTKTPFRPDNVNTGIENHELTDFETMALHWRLDTQTTSDSSGEFTGFDFASGSAENASRNSWLGGVTGHKYPFKGEGFIVSSGKAFDKRFIYSAKQRKFGVLMSSDGVTIKNDVNTLLFVDDDVSDNFYAFEKSYSGVISEEMLKMFASLVEFNDLIGSPIDGYKKSYKELEKLSRLFFEKAESRIEPERFFDFYKWIDNSIMFALAQLFPASAKYSNTSRNLIESHVLERNKYDRKFPLLVDVTATEGFAKGIHELLYNWRVGHAPVDNAENKSCAWQKHRKERTDITDRQTLLDSLNSGNNSKHLAKLKDDGTAYVGSTYALRNFSKLSKFSVQMDKNIHGGINYSENKDRNKIWDETYIHGPVSKQYPRGIPQNVLTVGLGDGQGTDDFVDCVDEEYPATKKKWSFKTLSGRKTQTDSNGINTARDGYEYESARKGTHVWPNNLISGSVTTGYNAEVNTKFKSGVIITNVHSDTYAPGNDIGMQGPFTETWVGGHQSRHVNLNSYDSSKTTTNNLDNQYSREEGWRLLLKECAPLSPYEDGSISGSNDGAMGLVGPDYGGPYPDISRKYATRYREERAKRPVNVKNIRTTTSSVRAGNFKENYEVINTGGRREHFRASAWLTGSDGDITSSVMSSFYNNHTKITQEASLVGVVAQAGPPVIKATGVIRIAVNPTDGDTITIGDGVAAPITYTFRSSPSDANDIEIGGAASVTRTNLRNRINSDFNITASSVSVTLELTNNNAGTIGNFGISAAFASGSNTVVGLSGGIGIVGFGGGNLAMNFNNTNRIPIAIRDQNKYDPNLRTKSIIASRFSAPGGFDTMSEVYLDVPSKEYSVYNAMPFRNLMVRGSGSGEAGTIRLNDIHNNRFGLQTHLRRHAGQFGFDSVVGSETTQNSYVTTPSFHKINRNRLIHIGNSTLEDYTPATSSQFDNGFVTHQIPRSDYQYSWITSSVGSNAYSRFYGFAPNSGLVSSSAEGYVNAYDYFLSSSIPIYFDVCELTASRFDTPVSASLYYPYDLTNATASFQIIDPVTNEFVKTETVMADNFKNDCGYSSLIANYNSAQNYNHTFCGLSAGDSLTNEYTLLGPQGQFRLFIYNNRLDSTTGSIKNTTLGFLSGSFEITGTFFSYNKPYFFFNDDTDSGDHAFKPFFRPYYNEDSTSTSQNLPYSVYGKNIKLTRQDQYGTVLHNDPSIPSDLNLQAAIHYTASYEYIYDMTPHHRDNNCPDVPFELIVSGTLIKPMWNNGSRIGYGVYDNAITIDLSPVRNDFYLTSGSITGLATYSAITLNNMVYTSSVPSYVMYLKAQGFSSSDAGDVLYWGSNSWETSITASLADYEKLETRGINYLDYAVKLSQSNDTTEYGILNNYIRRANTGTFFANQNSSSMYPARLLFKNNSAIFESNNTIYYRKGRSGIAAQPYGASTTMLFDQTGTSNNCIFTSSNNVHGFGAYEIQYSGAMTTGWVTTLQVSCSTFDEPHATALPHTDGADKQIRIYARLSGAAPAPYDHVIGGASTYLDIQRVTDRGSAGFGEDAYPQTFTGADGLVVTESAAASSCAGGT